VVLNVFAHQLKTHNIVSHIQMTYHRKMCPKKVIRHQCFEVEWPGVVRTNQT